MSTSAAPISSEMMFAPVAAMSDFRVSAHPKLSELARRTDAVIEMLEAIAAGTGSEDSGAWGDGTDPAGEAATRENWYIVIGHIRTVQTELRDGLSTRRFVREVKKHNRAAAPALENAIAAALTALREHLAFAELMAGEEDSTGIEMLTVADEGLPGPSAPIEW